MSEAHKSVINGGQAMDLVRTFYEKNKQLVKYFIIGASASLLDVALFVILYQLAHTSVLVAQTVSVSAAILYSFLINARHNFHTNDYMWLRLASFVVVCVIGYAVGFGIIKGLMAVGINANLGKLASLPVVFVIQYILNSRITFRKVREQSSVAAQ